MKNRPFQNFLGLKVLIGNTMDAYIGASNDRHGSLKKDAKKIAGKRFDTARKLENNLNTMPFNDI